jgi:hypothetical protein
MSEDFAITEVDRLVLNQADQLYHLRASRDRLLIALEQAVNGFWKAAELQHSIPPEHLHRLLVWHRDLARNALERSGDDVR